MVINDLYSGPITRTKHHRVSVTLSGTQKGKSNLAFFIDDMFAGRVEEWDFIWYDKITNGGPDANSTKIADNRVDAFKWWLKKNGFEAPWATLMSDPPHDPIIWEEVPAHGN